MQQKKFEDVFNKNFLLEHSLLIDEKKGQCCDFLLLELVQHLNYTIFQYNDTGSHLQCAFSKYNVNSTIKSIYFHKYNSESIIDDVSVQQQLGFNQKSKVAVFRSNTATESDYYNYDLVIIVERLKSGCSCNVDGNIRILKRDVLVLECKYKVYSDRIVYFD